MYIDTLAIATKAVFLAPDNTVLLLREASTYTDGTMIGKLTIPGGRNELGESIQDGLQREILEETGIDIGNEIRHPFAVSEWRPKIREKQWHIIALFFLIQVDEKPAVSFSDEHEEAVWISIDDYKNNPDVSKDEYCVFEALKSRIGV